MRTCITFHLSFTFILAILFWYKGVYILFSIKEKLKRKKDLNKKRENSFMKAIQVKNLVKVYDGKVKALNGVSFEVEEGSICSILGPNGAGKTTTIKIITTQIPQTEGEAKVFGMDVKSEGSKIRNLIGYVPQELSLWTDISAYENLLIYSKIYGIPRDVRDKRIAEVLDLMGLEEAANRVVSTFSGGMLRRLEIGSILLVKPKLIILDEPTIGLDPNARMLVWNKIMEYKKEYNSTIFFATHYMDEAEKYADKVFLLDMGKVVISGTPSSLKQLVAKEKIYIHLKNEDAQKALKILSNLKEVSIEEANGNRFVLSTKTSKKTLPKVLNLLYKNNIVVSEVSVKSPSLEDVFIKYTGHKIEEEGNIKQALATRRMIRLGQ